MSQIPTFAAAIILMAGLTQSQNAAASSWTKKKFMAAYPDLTEDQFGLIDLNDDGIIDPDEYLLALETGMIAPLSD